MTGACLQTTKDIKIPEAVAAEIRGFFPAFQIHPHAVFFDNAATTQKPQSVIEQISQFYSARCANAARASYGLSMQGKQSIEQARQDVARFIHGDASEIIFTSGSTESLNLVALAWGLANLCDGDEVMVCLDDHRSAVLPWFNLKDIFARMGKTIHVVPFNIHDVGDYDLRSIKSGISSRTRVIAVTHVHHVFGLDMEIPEIRSLVGPNVLISLDASQSVGHTSVDVTNLGVDFVSFSGHKMFAANGVGVLWTAASRLQQMAPIKMGGNSPATIRSGNLKIEAADSQLFECGTLDIPAISSLSTAIQFIEGLGIAAVEERVSRLTSELAQLLSRLPGIQFAPGPMICGCPGGYGILSFRFDQLSTSDLVFALDNEQVFIRAGDHCRTQIGDIDEFVRVSLHVYNTMDEINRFVGILESYLQ